MSQPTFHQLLEKGIRRNFGMAVETTTGGLKFSITTELFCALVIVEEFEPEPDFQAVKTVFWFCDSTGELLDFAAIPDDDYFYLCRRLSRSLHWGTLTPIQGEEGSVIGIYDCFDTDTDDVELMSKMDSDDSRLLRGLLRLCREAEMLYPVLYGISTGQIEDLASLEDFLSIEDETEH